MIRNFYRLTLLVFLLFAFQPTIFAQKYSVDKEQKVRKAKKPFSLKYLFKKDASKVAARQVKKDDKRKAKIMKNEQKNNKKYQKRANDNNETGKDVKVYTRMRKYEKESKRRRKNKPTKNFFERLFSKSKKRKSSKS